MHEKKNLMKKRTSYINIFVFLYRRPNCIIKDRNYEHSNL